MLAGTALGNLTGGLLADRPGQPGGIGRRPRSFAAIFAERGVPWLRVPWSCRGSAATSEVVRLARDALRFSVATCRLRSVAISPAGGMFHLVRRPGQRTWSIRAWMLATTLWSRLGGDGLLLVIRRLSRRPAPFEEFDPIIAGDGLDVQPVLPADVPPRHGVAAGDPAGRAGRGPRRPRRRPGVRLEHRRGDRRHLRRRVRPPLLDRNEPHLLGVSLWCSP